MEHLAVDRDRRPTRLLEVKVPTHAHGLSAAVVAAAAAAVYGQER